MPFVGKFLAFLAYPTSLGVLCIGPLVTTLTHSRRRPVVDGVFMSVLLWGKALEVLGVNTRRIVACVMDM